MATKKTDTKAVAVEETTEVVEAPAKKTAAKKTATKKTATKKAATKKAEATTEVAAEAVTEAAPAKKTAAKKAPAKKATTAKKAAATKVEFFVEYGGQQVSVDEVIKNVKVVNGKAAKDIKIFLKPDESKAYFVADGEEKEMDVFFC